MYKKRTEESHTFSTIKMFDFVVFILSQPTRTSYIAVEFWWTLQDLPATKLCPQLTLPTPPIDTLPTPPPIDTLAKPPPIDTRHRETEPCHIWRKTLVEALWNRVIPTRLSTGLLSLTAMDIEETRVYLRGVCSIGRRIRRIWLSRVCWTLHWSTRPSQTCPPWWTTKTQLTQVCQ